MNHNPPQEWAKTVFFFFFSFNILIIFSRPDWARLNHLAARISTYIFIITIKLFFAVLISFVSKMKE